MSRSDEILYTGITSVSSNAELTPRLAQREQKEKDRLKLKPAADVVLEALAKERANITDIRSLIVDRTTTEQELNTELIARKLYLGYLNVLETKIKNIMAIKQPRVRKVAEDE